MKHSAGRLWARWGFDPELGFVNGIKIEWHEGKFTAAEAAAVPPADFLAAEIHDGLVTPGLLNAHAHLNYAGGDGLPQGDFVRWLRAIIRMRRQQTPAAMDVQAAKNAAVSLKQLLGEGTTEIWDIASYSAGREALQRAGVDGISFYEVLAPHTDDAEADGLKWQTRLKKHAVDCGIGLVAGIGPHTVYTLAPELARRLAEWNHAQHWPVAVHLAESPEEIELFMQGRGALRELLAEAGANAALELAPGTSPIAHAQALGLLGPGTLAIHANLPQAGDVERLAESGTSVAFCPRSHAWFGYPAYPLEKYRAAGISLALGTDSLASNAALSLRAELRHMLQHWPAALAWSPRELLGLATGALLGTAPPFGSRGRLAVGCAAHWAAWQVDELPAYSYEEKVLERWLEAPLMESSALAPTVPAR